MTLLLLPSGAVLVVWPDGRAVRIEREPGADDICGALPQVVKPSPRQSTRLGYRPGARNPAQQHQVSPTVLRQIGDELIGHLEPVQQLGSQVADRGNRASCI